MAKISGIVAATAVFVLWFFLIGTRPVLETMIGIAAAAGGGLWAYRAMDKWLTRRRDGQP